MADEAKKPAAKKKAAAKKAAASKKPAAKAEAKKPAAKSEAKKPAAKKTAAKKTAAKKAPAKKAAAKKAAAKKRAAISEPTAPPIVKARARYVRVAPRKARLVADQVRGLPLADAQTLLRFSPRGAAQNISKLIASAAANAENNHDLIADELIVKSINVDEGPTLKRYRPRALGRATPIHKRTCHIAVALTPEESD